MKKIILIAYALTCTASLYAGHSKELKLTSPEGEFMKLCSGRRKFLLQ